MAFWKTDLTTEDGAMDAAQLGGFACFIAAGLTALSIAMLIGVIRDGSIAPYVALIGIVESVVFLVAGFRLRGGHGVVSGSVAAAFLVLELILKLFAMAFGIALVINVILLIGVVNGIRGARALKAGAFDSDEAAEIFR